MDPRFTDPNNHAPEIAEGDDWGDVEKLPASRTSGAPSLPPRRPGGTRGGEPVERDDEDPGLRIEPKEKQAKKPSEDESAVRLEVLELGREPTGSPPAPRPAIVARQVIDAPATEPAPAWHPMGGEGREWGNVTPPGSMRWMIYWGLGIVVLLVVGMALKPLIDQRDQSSGTSRFSQMEVVEEQTEAEMEESDPILMLESDSRAAFAAYARAKSVDEMVPLVRDGEALREILEQEWEPLSVPAGWLPGDEMSNQIFQNDSRTYAVVSGILPDFSPCEAYLVPADGRVVVDWEATIARGSATFGELGRGEGDGSFIRGAVIRSDFYTAGYPEKEYRSYRLVSVNPDEAVWAYTRRGSEADEAIGNLFRPGAILHSVQSEYRVCLSLKRGSTDSLPNQWEIGELLHIDWVRP